MLREVSVYGFSSTNINFNVLFLILNICQIREATLLALASVSEQLLEAEVSVSLMMK